MKFAKNIFPERLNLPFLLRARCFVSHLTEGSFTAFSLMFFNFEIPCDVTIVIAESGRRRDHSRRPPTPPDVPFGIRRFLSSVSGVSFVPLTIRLLVSGHLHGPRDFRPLLPSQALSRGFCPTSQRGSPLSARDRFGPSLQTGSYYGFC